MFISDKQFDRLLKTRAGCLVLIGATVTQFVVLSPVILFNHGMQWLWDATGYSDVPPK